MAFTYVGGNAENGTGTTADNTHGLTISSGDLVVAYVNRNDSLTIDNDGGGAAWTEALQETPPTGETASHALFWKIAGASEPSTYSWTLNGSDAYQSIVKVFSSAADAVVDAAAVGAKYTTSSSPIVVNAIDGEVISNDAVSLVFGGKDRNNATTRTYTSADNSYVSPLGSTDGRMTAGAHRIYTTGTTFSGNVTITPNNTTTSDVTYNMHISFVEGGGGPATWPRAAVFYHPLNGPFRGPIS